MVAAAVSSVSSDGGGSMSRNKDSKELGVNTNVQKDVKNIGDRSRENINEPSAKVNTSQINITMSPAVN